MGRVIEEGTCYGPLASMPAHTVGCTWIHTCIHTHIVHVCLCAYIDTKNTLASNFMCGFMWVWV